MGNSNDTSYIDGLIESHLDSLGGIQALVDDGYDLSKANVTDVIEYALKNGISLDTLDNPAIDLSKANVTDLVEYAVQNGISLDALDHPGIDISKADVNSLVNWAISNKIDLTKLQHNGINISDHDLTQDDINNLQNLKNSDVQQFDLSSLLNNISGNTTAESVPIEDFMQMSYLQLMADFVHADSILDNGNGNAWRATSYNITSATDAFNDALRKQEDLNQWQGQTHDAAIANITQSLAEPAAMGAGAA
ncbi:hypothetical protein, partial [Mycobacterium sp. 1482292.6]